ncbi:MAG: argininosuccinate lyase [Candidatus Sumerlaeaceae bacterium]|nr:argininosuccinate lyase [Candidatus Sumerlaeaceae bacterium]
MSKNKKTNVQVWGERMKEPPDSATVAYCAGRDVAARPMADAVLVPYDLWQNRAHVTMLARQKIIESPAAIRILQALSDFERRWFEGKIALDPQKEDVHINIEHFVAALVGENVAGKLHTARSRNDQSATVVRMYVRDQLLSFGENLCRTTEAVVQLASRHLKTVVAGLTHYQPASVTTFGHWFASYAQALLRDTERILASYDRINVSPLGAAASFGTSWPIDRHFAAKCLGFADVQENSLDCITNRWEMEADAASAVAFAMTHLSIMAQDLILLSQPQYGLLELADRHTTGSSIMPQKRNPDFAEVTRAKTVVVQQLMTALLGIARGLVSGYNRDTQWTKYLIMDIFAEVETAPAVFRSVFETLRINKERAYATASAHFVNAVDVADTLARQTELSFREAYKIISRAVRECEASGALDNETVLNLCREEAQQLPSGPVVCDPLSVVGQKNHVGGPAPEAVGETLRRLKTNARALAREFAVRRRHLERAQEYLRQAISRLKAN